ncbi:MAG: YihY/virulence factor BrkB family protein [Nocardioides sp.]
MTSASTEGLGRDPATTPTPDDPRKPQQLSEVEKQSWKYIARKTWREFTEDQCTDLAAALTYYAVLSIFPAAIATMSLLNVLVDAEDFIKAALQVLAPLVSADTLASVEPVLRNFAESDAAGLALATGLILGLWSASGYVGAFSRAMNRIYEVAEGRPAWKLRLSMLGITLAMIVCVSALLVMLTVSGGLAESIGAQIGLADQTVAVWKVAKWPAAAVVAVLIIALLYWGTPNVKQPKFRWLSVGAVVALLVWVLASLAFNIYVANFASYNKTYGSLAGVVVALLFLWISNLALLLGAEVDAELERGRQLQAGIAAEEEIQLPARDTSGIEKAARKRAEDLARGRAIRLAADPHPDRDAGADQ